MKADSMATTPTSKRSVVVAFGTIGFCVGWVFLPATIDWLYYTTKPMAFIDGFTVWLFAVLFGASISLIPLFALHSENTSCSPKVRPLLTLGLLWLASGSAAFLIVRVVTAHVHTVTLSLPDRLVPAGLFFIPIVAGVAVALAGILARGRRRTSNP